MAKLIYPLGEQSFKDIREAGMVYVDKTAYIPMLLENKFYFLSRPRRFGKSLFLSTLEAFFKGQRELFHGLAIDTYEWDWVEYPVVRINFTSGLFRRQEDLYQALNYTLAENERQYGITPPEGLNPVSRFRSLISSLYDKFGLKVVVLVDEYDKPLLDVIDDDEKLNDNKYVMAGFYSVLKASDEHLKMVLLTGVTRFGHMNIFSGLNNIRDISLEPRFSAVCGIASYELEDYLHEGLTNFAEANKISAEEATQQLKAHYDGYHFSRDLVDIYNPYSLLTALSTATIENTWMESGNSFYLLRQLREINFNLFDLEGVEVDTETLKGSDYEYTDPIALLYDSGYLTIKANASRPGSYILGLPNQEVTTSLYRKVIPFCIGPKGNLRTKDFEGVAELLEAGKVDDFMLWLSQLFSKITYDVKLLPLADRMRQESDFQFVVFCILSLSCGLDNVEIEETTSNGRIDLSVTTSRYIYIFEFKIGTDASKALEQINSKGYAQRWAADRRRVIKVGVAFSPETRGIAEYEIEN